MSPLLGIAGLAILYLMVWGAKAALAARVARREPFLPPSDGAGVSIAQPILSGDPRLGAVLGANLAELPAARFLWLVDTDDTEAQRVCRDLAARHPEVKIEISLHPQPGNGVNPKLWKLEAARAARAERARDSAEPVLLVLDDDTRMPGGTLAALVSALTAPRHPEQERGIWEGGGLESRRPEGITTTRPPDPSLSLGMTAESGGSEARRDDGQAKAWIATSLPGYRDDGRQPSRLLAQFVDNNAALTYLPLLPLMKPLTINGMAYAMRWEKLNEIGGFAGMLGALTDDLAVAEAVLSQGGTIFQSARPHWVETTVRDGKHYAQLMHRWFLFALLLLRKQPLRIRALIGLLHALPPVLLLVLVITAVMVPSSAGFTVLIATLLLRGLGLAALQHAVYGRILEAPLTSIASELLQPLHTLHAICWRRIVWRTRRYRVHDDRHFTAIE